MRMFSPSTPVAVTDGKWGDSMKTRRLSRAVALLFVLGSVTVGLVAAGSAGAASDSSDSSNQFSNLKPIKAPNPCPNTDGVSADEIKVGTIGTTSGALAPFYGSIIDGVKARVAKANAEGELGKRKITLVNADDAGDTSRNVTAAQQLVEDDKVFGIITNTPAGDASGQYLNQQKVPVVGWQLGLPVYGTYTNYFGMQNANTKNIKTDFTSRNADVVKALGGTKLALVGNSIANGVIFTEQVKYAADHTKGLKTVLINHDIPPGTTEMGSIADQIKQSGADSLYLVLDTGGQNALIAALKQAGVKLKPIVIPGGYSPAVLNIPTYDDVYFGVEFKPYEITPAWPGLTEYKKWMASTSPSAALSQLTGVGWISANTFIEGLKAAGVSCPTRKAFINNLRLEKGYTADGFFDDIPINFADVFNKPFTCVHYVHVENKQFVPQFNGKPFCAKQLFKNNKALKNVQAPVTTTTVAPATTAAP
jgi:branched-chain amino acid transport system substrate-binding protein